MAQDGGGGVEPGVTALAPVLGMMPVIGGAAGAAVVAAADLAREAESMLTFKKRVDALLTKLNDSEAASVKIGADRLTKSELGPEDLKESAFLYGVYEVVHDQIGQLSKALGMQIEGLCIAVLAAENGYDGVDADVRDRMRAISGELHRQQELYGTDAPGTAGAPAPKAPDKGATGGSI
ncbi:hypothetical protein [Streptomyces melanogenes]|uniref:Uncharacterized protein n=1 Tax=Streptomyces melanogenes TaxID=67326 RepID=A0ABZ1XL87_9ACTN|nr:hypothetical protein [Streptomyces melanogenes]